MAFDFWSLFSFRSTTGFSTAQQLTYAPNSYNFELGDFLLLPSGKEIKLLGLISDNSVEVSVSGSLKIIKLNDYDILSDVRIFLASNRNGRVQLNIDDFTAVKEAGYSSSNTYLFLRGSKLLQDGNVIYMDNFQGGTVKLYVNGIKDSLSKGESKTLKQLKFTFVDIAKSGDVYGVKIRIEQARCADSDSGEQIFSKGKTEDSYGVSHEDYCVIIKNGVEDKKVSSCSGTNCYVKEGYCDARYEKNKALKSVKCQSSCLNGACLRDTIYRTSPVVSSDATRENGPDVYVTENSLNQITISWSGSSSQKFNVYMNKNDGYWTKIKALATDSFTLTSPATGVTYGFYVTGINSLGRESLPSLPLYQETVSKGECKDTDKLDSDKRGYVNVGNDFVFDECEENTLVESYCMENGDYGLKAFTKEAFVCVSGALKLKSKADCRKIGCGQGKRCVLTSVSLSAYDCVESPAEKPAIKRVV